MPLVTLHTRTWRIGLSTLSPFKIACREGEELRGWGWEVGGGRGRVEEEEGGRRGGEEEEGAEGTK